MTYFEQNNAIFQKSDLYKQLQKDFKHVYADWRDFIIPAYNNQDVNSVGSHRTNLVDSSICYYSMFVYLQLLLEKNPTKIADVGCGLNFVKKYIPNIVGFDKTPEADYQEFFDDDFIKDHYKEFDSAFSINSLHFFTLPEQISYRIDQFAKIIKPGGRGFATFNPYVMVVNGCLDINNIKTLKEYKNMFDTEVKKIKQKILVYDNFIPDQATPMFKTDYDTFKGDDWPSYENILDDSIESEDIKNEINALCTVGAINDCYNGRIRIVFEVDK